MYVFPADSASCASFLILLQITDALVAAYILNATLLVLKLGQKLFWKDSRSFSPYHRYKTTVKVHVSKTVCGLIFLFGYLVQQL